MGGGKVNNFDKTTFYVIIKFLSNKNEDDLHV